MNALLAAQALPIRCLPLAMGNIALFHKMLEAVHLQAVIVNEDHRGPVLSIATSLDDPAQQSQAVDLLRRKEKKWRGYNLLGKASQAALEAAMRAKSAAEEPLRGRVVMIVGVNASARMLAFEIKERGGMIVLASHDRAAAQRLAANARVPARPVRGSVLDHAQRPDCLRPRGQPATRQGPGRRSRSSCRLPSSWHDCHGFDSLDSQVRPAPRRRGSRLQCGTASRGASRAVGTSVSENHGSRSFFRAIG